jgi:hypothetical protein
MRRTFGAALAIVAVMSLASAAGGQDIEGAPYLRDRGTGLPTSMFGTYVRKGELLVYPFFEYYRDHNFEYKPEEMGFGLDEDFRGRYRASEGLLFIGYGISDRLAVEFEAAIITAELEKSPDDPSGVPARIEESGSGDVEGQIRYRWAFENERRPEIFSYFEAVSPQQKDKLLIGTPDWEFKLGSGLIKGYPWGTMTARLALDYEVEATKLDAGEYAVEYQRRLSRSWRIYLGLEGSQDELSFVPEAQWRVARRATVKLNSAVGVTSKATDWAPEVGVVFSFGNTEP